MRAFRNGERRPVSVRPRESGDPKPQSEAEARGPSISRLRGNERAEIVLKSSGMHLGVRRAGMSEVTISMIRARPVAAAAIVIAVGGAATVLGAWFFQFGLGLKPCPLCLEQRYPYYFAIPLAVLVLLGTSVGAQRKVLLAALFVIAMGMLWNAGLGAYHAGVEWKLWEGPRDCSGPLDNLGSAGDLMRQLESIRVVRC